MRPVATLWVHPVRSGGATVGSAGSDGSGVSGSGGATMMVVVVVGGVVAAVVMHLFVILLPVMILF